MQIVFGPVDYSCELTSNCEVLGFVRRALQVWRLLLPLSLSLPLEVFFEEALSAVRFLFFILRTWKMAYVSGGTVASGSVPGIRGALHLRLTQKWSPLV
jgi:hypothetical protein